MIQRILILVILLAAIGWGITRTDHQPKAPGPVTAQAPTLQPTTKPSPAPMTGKLVTGRAGYEFLAWLPRGYGETQARWPAIVFLHGQGMGSDVMKGKDYGPIKYALDHPELPCIVVAPVTPDGWNIPFLRSMVETMPFPGVDTDRIYLTGHSMGAHATWRMALEYPDLFAAIAPVSGAGDGRLARVKLAHLPAWVFHGQADTIVPLSRGLEMIGALKPFGHVRYTIYPEAGHNIDSKAYNDPELYEWLLDQNRKKNHENAAPGADAASIESGSE
ncbi:MAG: phospholipase [bacterium]|nr:phospholipase [bacterium]